MTKMKTMISSLALVGVLAFGALAQTPMAAKTMHATKPAKAAPAAKSDADIQADIQKRLAAFEESGRN